jgi:hypothetical protein
MWAEFLESPKAVEMFNPEPSLDNVRLSALLLDHNGPAVTMTIQVRDYPVNPPVKWRIQQYNTVTIEVQGVGLEQITMAGWAVDNLVSMVINRLPEGKLSLHATGQATEIEMRCGWLRILGVKPYRKAA